MRYVQPFMSTKTEKTAGVIWAKVNFDQAGEKKLHLGFAKLMVVER